MASRNKSYLQQNDFDATRINKRATLCKVARKTKYNNKKLALTASNVERSKHGRSFLIYLCEHCNCYHLATEHKKQLLYNNLTILNNWLEKSN